MIGACSCGEAKPHVTARRTTADGKHVLLWDDGALTWALGYAIRRAPKGGTPFARKVGRLVLGDVELYDAAEVPDLIEAARWAAVRSVLPGDMRRRYREITEPKGPRPAWTVISADRDGRPMVRVWKLPRLGWPGLAVWHERGRYEVVREMQRGTGTYEATGFRAGTLREFQTLLPTLQEVTR